MSDTRTIRRLARTLPGVAVVVGLAGAFTAANDATATKARPGPVEPSVQTVTASTPREAWEASVNDGYRHLIKSGGAMAYVEEDPRLPRVLIIGDSISIGYTPTVRKALAGKANVLRIPDNANNTAHGRKHLADWLGEGRWDVIHFNWGLHDCFRKVPLEEYTANLEALVSQLEKTGARLVWASSTPIPDGNPWTKKPAGELAYNAAALAVMEKHGIPVDDLHAVIAPKFAEFVTAPTDVHFKGPGSELLGQAVAAVIEERLPAPASR